MEIFNSCEGVCMNVFWMYSWWCDLFSSEWNGNWMIGNSIEMLDWEKERKEGCSVSGTVEIVLSIDFYIVLQMRWIKFLDKLDT